VFYIIMVQNKTFRKSCSRLGFIMLARYSEAILWFAIFYVNQCVRYCSILFLRIALLNILKRSRYAKGPWTHRNKQTIRIFSMNFLLHCLLITMIIYIYRDFIGWL
jgi:hypothetical protein